MRAFMHHLLCIGIFCRGAIAAVPSAEHIHICFSISWSDFSRFRGSVCPRVGWGRGCVPECPVAGRQPVRFCCRMRGLIAHATPAFTAQFIFPKRVCAGVLHLPTCAGQCPGCHPHQHHRAGHFSVCGTGVEHERCVAELRMYFCPVLHAFLPAASVVFMGDTVVAERRMLAVFPVCLFYIVMAWMVYVQ